MDVFERVQYEVDGPRRWRPQPFWLPMGLLLGIVCGAVAGTMMLGAMTLIDGTGFDLEVAMLGAVVGGMCGCVVGTFVGAVMTFLVGVHLPRQQARERAFLVAFLTTGTLCLLFGVLSLFHPIAILTALFSALAAGSLSYWVVSMVTT